MLTEKRLAFADRWRPGKTLDAMRAAGFSGSVAALRAEGSKLLRNAEVRAAIEKRGIEPPPLRPGRKGPAKRERVPVVVKPNRRVGTTTQRVELMMAIARDTKETARDRIAATKLAALICGEVGPGRFVPAPAPRVEDPIAPAAPEVPASASSPGSQRFRLVVNKADAGLHG